MIKINGHKNIKMKKNIKYIIFFISLLIILIISSFIFNQNKSIKIGVFLIDTENNQNPPSKILYDWSLNRINKNGGINGKKIELIYKFVHIADWSTYWENIEENIQKPMQELIDKSGADIFIGEGAEALAPIAIANKKILIGPNDTRSFLFRAYGKKDYFWRISQSDVAQVRTAMHILAKQGVKKIAFLGEHDNFGGDYYEWIGFFAEELGIEITSINKYKRGEDILPSVRQIVRTKPDYLVAYSVSEDVVLIKKELHRLGSSVKLFLADQSISVVGNASIVKELGVLAEGIEGTDMSYDQNTNFSVIYQNEFNKLPNTSVAQIYDSLLLATYITARQRTTFFEDIRESAKKIIYGQGEPIRWDETAKGIKLITAGQFPNISGASGPLDFDTLFGVDPIQTYYSHWQIKNGKIKIKEVLGTDESAYMSKFLPGSAVARSQASAEGNELTKKNSGEGVFEKKHDSWAVILSASNGWQEYRHQSDALAIYDMLKQNGFSDDKIILLIYDDVAWADENPLKGVVRNDQNGKNLRRNVEIDYSGTNVSPEILADVLMGKKNEITPQVLESDNNDNVFLYIVDHGAPGFVAFNNNKKMTAQNLNTTIEEMYNNKKYRQLFIMVDTCFGESIGEKISAPGVIYFTGANKSEPSFGAKYDSKLKQWISDEFTSKVLDIIQNNSSITIEELFYETYNQIIGSHAVLLNYENFGNLKISIKEFITP